MIFSTKLERNSHPENISRSWLICKTAALSGCSESREPPRDGACKSKNSLHKLCFSSWLIDCLPNPFSDSLQGKCKCKQAGFVSVNKNIFPRLVDFSFKGKSIFQVTYSPSVGQTDVGDTLCDIRDITGSAFSNGSTVHFGMPLLVYFTSPGRKFSSWLSEVIKIRKRNNT